MRDSEALCPGPVQLLLNSVEFYQFFISESEASTECYFICGCALGGTGHSLHLPLCITIKPHTKALNLHLGQQELFCTDWYVRNVHPLILKGQRFPCSKYAYMSWRWCVQNRETGKKEKREPAAILLICALLCSQSRRTDICITKIRPCSSWDCSNHLHMENS